MPSTWPFRSPVEGDAVLIAAQSGRALAAAARRAGLRPYVVDLFGDSDTRALASGYRRAEGRFGEGIGSGHIFSILDDLAREAGAPLGVILGSGFEAAPDRIAAISARYPILGCSAATVRAVKDPARFSVLLGRLGIPHPPIRFETPPDPENWIVKRAGGSGGGHIRLASKARPGRSSYFQRRVGGTPHSFAFLANGHDVAILATTRQWASPSRQAPFRYGGAVEPGTIAPGVASAATEALRALVAATGLRGLASADCLVEGDSWWLLEINPRPGATLDILDRRATPLLQAHIEACLGRLPTLTPPPDAAASEILYAPRSIPVVPSLDWPDYALDRPEAGSAVPGGAPFCTVLSEGATAAEALLRLEARSSRIRAACFREGIHHATASRTSERQRSRRTVGGGAGC